MSNIKNKYDFDINVVKELYVILNKAFPILDIENRKPLSIGFKFELMEATGLNKRMLQNFLKWYCNITYHKLIKEGAFRYNLKGEIVDVVKEKEIMFSSKRVNHNKEKQKLEHKIKVKEFHEKRKDEFLKAIEKARKIRIKKEKKAEALNNDNIVK